MSVWMNLACRDELKFKTKGSAKPREGLEYCKSGRAMAVLRDPIVAGSVTSRKDAN
jgi:hypothetical protein